MAVPIDQIRENKATLSPERREVKKKSHKLPSSVWRTESTNVKKLTLKLWVENALSWMQFQCAVTTSVCF